MVNYPALISIKIQKKPPVFETGGIHQGASTYSFLPIDSGSIRTKWEKEQMEKRVPSAATQN